MDLKRRPRHALGKHIVRWALAHFLAETAHEMRAAQPRHPRQPVNAKWLAQMRIDKAQRSRHLRRQHLHRNDPVEHVVEGAEDDPRAGEADLRGIDFCGKDVLVGIAASGRTPYVVGAMKHARTTGAGIVALVEIKGNWLFN